MYLTKWLIALVYWFELPSSFLWMRAWWKRNTTPQDPVGLKDPGEKNGLFHTIQRVGLFPHDCLYRSLRRKNSCFIISPIFLFCVFRIDSYRCLIALLMYWQHLQISILDRKLYYTCYNFTTYLLRGGGDPARPFGKIGARRSSVEPKSWVPV